MRNVIALILLVSPVVLAQGERQIRHSPIPLDNDALTAALERSLAEGRASIMPRMGTMGEVVKGAPYSAEAVTETVQLLADGTRIQQKSSFLIYRDSQGRLRRDAPTPPGIWIFDTAAHSAYILDQSRQTARRLPLGDEIIRHERVAPKDKTESLGRRIIEGVEAEGSRTTTVIPANEIGNDRPIQIVSERWESPDLKVTVLSRSTDPRKGETVFRLTSIHRGEPAASLFEVPAGYQIVTAEQGREPRRRAPHPQ